MISTAINQYIYVTVKKHSELFEEKVRLSYYKTEHVQKIEDIENGVARECINLVGIDQPVYISTTADMPAASGLGSSSSFAVGLLNALHLIKGERVSPGQLAEEACEVEINKLKHPIGKQDQYAAAFGGLNHMTFEKNGRVNIDALVTPNKMIDYIFENSMLVWSGIQRDANKILSEQSKMMKHKIKYYEELKSDVSMVKQMLLNQDGYELEKFAEMISRSWKAKKSLRKRLQLVK